VRHVVEHPGGDFAEAEVAGSGAPQL